MSNELSISKRMLWRYVNLKIKRVVHSYHVLSVMTILFDEIVTDLLKGKSIKIYNFGTLSLKQMKPRKYFDVRFKKVMHSKGHKIMRFVLAPLFKKKVAAYVQLDKPSKDE